MDFDSFLGGLAGGTAIQIIIQAQDQYSSELSKAERQVSASSKKMGVAVAAVATAATAAGVAMFQFAQQSARTEAAQRSFNRILGAESTETLRRLREATHGTVSDFELLTKANIFFQNISGATPEQFLKIAEAAGPLARAVGISIPEAYERLVQGIAKGETELLDELGLKLDATIANKKYADSIGKSVSELTAQERATAALINVLPELEKRLKALPEIQEDVITKSERMSASWRNFTDQLGESTAPAISAILDGLTEALEKIEKLSTYETVLFGAATDVLMQKVGLQDDVNDLKAKEIIFLSSATGQMIIQNQYAQAQLQVQESTTQEIIEQNTELDKQIRKYEHMINIGGGRYVKRDGSGIYREREGGGYEQIGDSSVKLKPRQNDFVMRGETLVPFSQQDTIIGFKGNKVPGGATFVFNDMTVQGLDADAVAEAIQRKLSRALTI